jgi:hypothetical protein
VIDDCSLNLFALQGMLEFSFNLESKAFLKPEEAIFAF